MLSGDFNSLHMNEAKMFNRNSLCFLSVLMDGDNRNFSSSLGCKDTATYTDISH